MKTITEKEFKERSLYNNRMAAAQGIVNPYNYNHSHGISQRGRMVKGVQRVKRKEKSKTGHWVYALIGHVIGYLKKRK